MQPPMVSGGNSPSQFCQALVRSSLGLCLGADARSTAGAVPMNGQIAQAAALVCHGNAVLRGMHPPTFWPTNSTAQFCDRIRFVRFARKWLGGWRSKTVASAPDEWFVQMRQNEKRSLFLSHSPSSDSRLSDRLSSAFVGGGGNWLIEAAGPDTRAHLWAARWTVWNKKAPDRRIWRVEYGMVGEGKSSQPQARLEEIQRELTEALDEIRLPQGSGSRRRFEHARSFVPRRLPISMGLRRNGFVERPGPRG